MAHITTDETNATPAGFGCPSRRGALRRGSGRAAERYEASGADTERAAPLIGSLITGMGGVVEAPEPGVPA